MVNYNNKKFRPITNTENGETSHDTIFHYIQNENILTSAYQGGNILVGHLIGLVDNDGNINMCYHQINKMGQLMTGKCQSRPEFMTNGKIRLHEKWEWTSGDLSSGHSIIEEI
jgi:hypothetical protein